MSSRFQKTLELCPGYTARKIDFDLYRKLSSRFKSQLGGGGTMFARVRDTDARQRGWVDAVDKNLYRLTLSINAGEALVGLHFSEQALGAEVVMKYTALLPDHRGRGVYSALLRELVAEFRELGFKAVRSRHRQDNHVALRAKLREGFVITALTCDLSSGWFVETTLPLTEAGRRALRYWTRDPAFLPSDESCPP
jgi:GNAT superfamily N-acetyltransferase